VGLQAAREDPLRQPRESGGRRYDFARRELSRKKHRKRVGQINHPTAQPACNVAGGTCHVPSKPPMPSEIIWLDPPLCYPGKRHHIKPGKKTKTRPNLLHRARGGLSKFLESHKPGDRPIGHFSAPRLRTYLTFSRRNAADEVAIRPPLAG
jgi:hypothetical protein